MARQGETHDSGLLSVPFAQHSGSRYYLESSPLWVDTVPQAGTLWDEGYHHPHPSISACSSSLHLPYEVYPHRSVSPLNLYRRSNESHQSPSSWSSSSSSSSTTSMSVALSMNVQLHEQITIKKHHHHQHHHLHRHAQRQTSQGSQCYEQRRSTCKPPPVEYYAHPLVPQYPSPSDQMEPHPYHPPPAMNYLEPYQSEERIKDESIESSYYCRYPEVAAHVSSLPTRVHSLRLPTQPPSSNGLNLCLICGKSYARPSTLKTHLRTHSGEKPYRCSYCPKAFSQAANLTAHVRTHSGEKPFPCPVCHRRFSQSSSVTTHLRTHSGERPYRCSFCRKAFSDSSTLTKHLRIHSGEKPYQCSQCLLRFSQSGNLNRHMRIHA